MIDTIAFILSERQFTIFKHNLFKPHADVILNRNYHMGGGYVRAFQNPSKSDLNAGNYKPRLTLKKRLEGIDRYKVSLKVELSLPKLLYKNNFDELSDSDLNDVTQALRKVLNDMGVYTTVDEILNSDVVVIHFSKNMAFTDFTSASMYLRELAKVNMNMKLDVNQTDFRNGGHSIKYRTNKREIVFYDKIKDLQQARISDKRSEETDNAIQLELFSERKVQKPLEVLRMEIRLGDMKTIRKALSDSGIQVDLKFGHLFSEQVSKKVLNMYWTVIKDNYLPVLSDDDLRPEEYLMRLLNENTDLSKMKLLAFVGLRSLTDSIGIRDLRSLLQRYGYSGWYGLMKDLKTLKYTTDQGLFKAIDKTLTSFVPLKLVDFEEQMLNNDKYAK